MPEPTPSRSDLFDRNLVFLDTALPGIAAMARQGAAQADRLATRLVADAGGRATDIDLGAYNPQGGRLYGAPVDDFARTQVAKWLAAPLRLALDRPQSDGVHDACLQRMTDAMEAAAAADAALLPMPPLERTGLLVIVGLGLGLHALELVARLTPRHVVIVEPVGEFVVHSLSAIDWTALAGGGHNPDMTLDVIAGLDPRETQKQLEELMLRFGACAIDGAALYVHYDSDDTLAIARGVQELAGVAAIQQGYVADETLMVENLAANAAAHDFHLVDGDFQAPHDLPAFIVGSGPSLDAALETIARWQDRAVIFCAGSALQSLLLAGIVPDFQVDKENNEITEARVAHMFERTRHLHDGETFGVDLMASITVRPGAVARFDDKFLFHRQFLSSTRLFGRGHEPVVATGPFSANTALALAATLGFRKIYLFGCDCGTVDRTRHHAAETVYNTAANHPQGHTEMPTAVPANFGGEAWTNRYYAMSRWVLESMIANAGLDAVNCSDGVAIAGAAPLQPEALEMTGAPLDKPAVKRVIRGMYRHYAPGAYLAGQDVAGAQRGFDAFAGEFRVFLDDALAAEGDFHGFVQAVGRFLDAADARYGGLAVWLAGSARGMLPAAGYYIGRAQDGIARKRLMAAFRERYRAEIEAMLAEAGAVLAQLETAGDPERLAG